MRLRTLPWLFLVTVSAIAAPPGTAGPFDAQTSIAQVSKSCWAVPFSKNRSSHANRSYGLRLNYDF